MLRREDGFALITVLIAMSLLVALVGAYFTLTGIELSSTSSSMNSVRGFYAAEAASNLRADVVRQTFQGYNRPGGYSPVLGGETAPCVESNQGSGDLGCVEYAFDGRTTATFLAEDTANPTAITIPRGEQFQNLNAQEYRYVAHAVSENRDERVEAAVEMHFKSRLVPMFQFAAFYNKDLEILPGPTMTLAGPVHSNGDLYLGSNNSLEVMGQVTTAGDLFHGRKNTDSCMPGGVAVDDPEVLQDIPNCDAGRREIYEADVVAWNDMIRMGVDVLTVPPPEALDPVPGETYWDKADVRIMMDLDDDSDDDSDGAQIEVYAADGTVNDAHTAALDGCDAVSHSDSLYNHREGTSIEMLDVDVRELLDCLHDTSILGDSTDIDESSEGGLVWYLGVRGSDDDVVNNYGVRVHNGGELASTDGTAPEIRGLTVVTNQAMYVEGDYNSVDKKPAAFLADSLNVLSNAWDDSKSSDALDDRIAANTTINAAFLAGTDTTGGVEGSGGQDAAIYNGGLENYPRFHEKWGGKKLTYRGSFVSLNTPRHVDGLWEDQSYQPPTRDWGYDTDFNSAENLPPLSPRFVYLRQELFLRQFDL
ncbi:MAG: hypothetical protein GY716_13030 [bacterium]|nr:hypothetical protein [bacterium]